MTIYPDFEQFSKNFVHNNQIIYSSFPADLIKPIAAILKLQDFSKWHFLLESVQDGERNGRYCVIGLGADLIFKINGNDVLLINNETDAKEEFVNINPLDKLQELIDGSKLAMPHNIPPMSAGLFGYLGYDIIRLIEEIPDNNDDALGIDDAIFIRPEIMVIFDAVGDLVHIICPVWKDNYNIIGNNKKELENIYQAKITSINDVIDKLNEPINISNKNDLKHEEIEFTSNLTKEKYHDIVDTAIEYIKAGDIFQVVPSQRFSADFNHSAIAIYRALRYLNPSPYMFYLHFDDINLIGSSPEIMVRLTDNIITGRPIAGTRKRGQNSSEDSMLAKDLLSDSKELAEHLMLLDLGRNDIGKVAKIGSVKVVEQFIIEYYSHVMHIVSEIQGKKDDSANEIDIIKAAFPVGTVSGAPKIRAMEIIDELENTKRKFYAGGVGYISANGNVDICITLRTALLKNNKLYLQAGGGVVADSDREAEYQETIDKAEALKKAASLANNFL
ncbi:MAG: anthranilate synthase component I [Pseudomonadota bacterium]